MTNPGIDSESIDKKPEFIIRNEDGVVYGVISWDYDLRRFIIYRGAHSKWFRLFFGYRLEWINKFIDHIMKLAE